MAGVIRRTFISLRHRNYRLFFIGQTVSNTGNWLTNVALTLLVLHLTDSGVAVGTLTAAQYGPLLVLAAAGGAIADRGNKRNLLFVTQTLEMLQSFVLAGLAFMHDPPLWALYVVASLGGVFLALDNPLRRSFVTEMVPAHDRPNAIVLYSLIVNISRIAGPALAGALIVGVGYGWAFVVDAVSYVVVLVALWMMRPGELLRIVPRPRQKGEVREGIRYVARTPVLAVPFVMLAIVGSLGYNFNVTLPLLVKHSLHGSDGTFTFVYTMFSVGAVVGGLVVANRTWVELRHIVVGSVLLGVAMLLLAGAPNAALAATTAVLIGLTSIVYMTATTSIVQVEAEPEFHGRVLALQTSLMVGTAPIGGPALGWLADALGARSPIALGALSCFGAAAYGAYAGRRSVTAPSTSAPTAQPVHPG
jgi:MFS family permease